MCVGFWSLEHPDYALILCTNRDEFLSRPTVAAHFHSFCHGTEGEGNVLSGRDLRAGGTWLGVSRFGRVALLTNITGPPSDPGSSRGDLVSSYLLSDPANSFEGELAKLNSQDTKFAGFNLLLLSPTLRDPQALSFDAALVTNHGAGGEIISRPLSNDERLAGGLSNGIDGKGANEWPKVQYGVKYLREFLGPNMEEPDLMHHLFELLTWCSDEPVRDRSGFRNIIHIDPIPIEPNDGPSDVYGTRLSTVILIGRDGQVVFTEREVWRMDGDGKVSKANPLSECVFRFQLSNSPVS